jgi:hypothetical protein
LVGFSVYTAMGCVFKMPAFIEIIDISRSKLKFRKLWQFKK